MRKYYIDVAYYITRTVGVEAKDKADAIETFHDLNLDFNYFDTYDIEHVQAREVKNENE